MYQVLSNGLKFLEVDGTKGFYEIGLQMGRAFAQETRTLYETHKEGLRKTGCTLSSEEMVRQLTKESRYLEDIHAYAPAIFEQINGMAEGCGLTPDDIILLNFVEELTGLVARNKKPPESRGCTTGLLYGRPNLPNIAFMNADFFPYLTEYTVLYRIKYPQHTELSLTGIGCVGPSCGFNSKGLSLVANSIPDGACRENSGLPALPIESELLRCSTVEEAVAMLEKFPRSAGVSYLLMDHKDAANIEATANDLRYVREPVKGLQIHTNHMLASTDFSPYLKIYDRWKAIPYDGGFSRSKTVERYQIAMEMLCHKAQTATVEDAVEVLRKTGFPLPTCTTNASMVCVYDKVPYVLVSKGVDPEREFVRVDF